MERSGGRSAAYQRPHFACTEARYPTAVSNSADPPIPESHETAQVSRGLFRPSQRHGALTSDEAENDFYPFEPPELDEYDLALLAEPDQGRERQMEPRTLSRISLLPRAGPSQFPGTSVRPEEGRYVQPWVPSFRTPHRNPVESQRGLSPALFISSPHFSGSSASGGHVPSSPSYQVSQRRLTQDPPQGSSTFRSAGAHASTRATVGAPSAQQSFHAGPTTPVVQGIPLISPYELPDRFRAVFPYPFFNAVQSKCFATVFKSPSNLVLSAPTGSGKTVLLELAICRLVSSLPNDQFKIIYMAPTKSLCSERFRDWSRRLRKLDLTCGELTGDTDSSHLKQVQSANIIITTPEKWDATTRKWKDHMRLMQLVKLFLIDEVHILKESRGASLEAVVSRMKSVGSNMRFIALSATVPNSEDIAVWLGEGGSDSKTPASREVFGEEFRPVKLQKHVYGYPLKGNDFMLDGFLDSKSVAPASYDRLTDDCQDSQRSYRNTPQRNQ